MRGPNACWRMIEEQTSGQGEPLRLFNRWIELAIQSGASDVHVDVQGNMAQVRVRVDGLLEPLADGNGGLYPRLDSIDALAAGYNNTRQGNNVSQYSYNGLTTAIAVGSRVIPAELHVNASTANNKFGGLVTLVGTGATRSATLTYQGVPIELCTAIVNGTQAVADAMNAGSAAIKTVGTQVNITELNGACGGAAGANVDLSWTFGRT
jgi:hypothetical protein